MSKLPSFCFLLAGLALAQTGPKPDFSGTWKLNLAKSKLEIPSPDSSMFYIDHKEPQFHLKRIHVYRGKADTRSIDLTTDGKEVVQKDASGDFHVRLRWEGSTLIFDSYWMAGASKGQYSRNRLRNVGVVEDDADGHKESGNSYAMGFQLGVIWIRARAYEGLSPLRVFRRRPLRQDGS